MSSDLLAIGAGLAALVWLAVVTVMVRRGNLPFVPVVILVLSVGGLLVGLIAGGRLPGFPLTAADVALFNRSWATAAGMTYLVILWRRHG